MAKLSLAIHWPTPFSVWPCRGGRGTTCEENQGEGDVVMQQWKDVKVYM